ncbi:MAG TPA: hypothetical protein PK725_17985 [Rhodocyclaceae bacterium]|nr:hypothetical protein [Rhodocyclaceae bacterium]
MRMESGEGHDSAFRRALPGVDQRLGANFFTLASKVFGPFVRRLLDEGASGR